MKRLLVVFVALATALAMSTIASADQQLQPQGPVPGADPHDTWVNESPTAWLVELRSPPAAAGTARATLAREQRGFLQEANRANLEFKTRFQFETLFNGYSIVIDSGQLFRLSQLDSVKAIHPVLEVQIPVTSVSGPELATALQLTGADIAQSEMGLTGEGIRVAIMDTGIDYNHPDLGGCFGDGCRVFTGWDFVGDDFNAGDPDKQTPAPNPDPMDCEGHGTHVAGIVGAEAAGPDGVTGVAPGVTFGAYKVFGCAGSTFSDIMIAAMEMALADGMDVLNMSIGSSFQWPQHPTAMASNLLVDAGMVVVASIGNSGASGTFSAGSPGLGEKVIGVASFENTFAMFPIAEVLGDGEVEPTDVGYNTMQFSQQPPTSGTAEIEFVGLACEPLGIDLTGKIALAERGTCAFAVKAENAVQAGAVATVIHNDAPGNFSGTLGAEPPTPRVVVSISQEDGLFIRELEEPVEWTWTDRVEAFPNPEAGLISSFSSYGLAPDLSLKPDIGAPGGNIWSTYPLDQGGYANLGGTSMSSPHVAGAAALMLEARPNTPAHLMRDLLQNSADPVVWWGAPTSGLAEPVHRQGAGMLDIAGSIRQGTTVTPGKLALGASGGSTDPVTRLIRIQNNGDDPVTYTLGIFSLAVATSGTMATELGFWLTDETIEFSRDTVTVRPGRSANIRVQVFPEAPDGAFDLVQYGGWITITPDDGSDVLRVPYAGFIGDYQALDVLTPSAFGVFPALGVTADGVSFGLVPPGWVYTMEGFDVPNLLLHLHHQSRRMTVQLFNADGTAVTPASAKAMALEYLPRNASNEGFFAFPWDGTLLGPGRGNSLVEVPDGEYYFVVTILKALGKQGTSGHTETWTSPVFVIDRP